jgi:hypothetical protein
MSRYRHLSIGRVGAAMGEWMRRRRVAAAPADTLAPGATVSSGFNGSHPGTNPRPGAFTPNGASCAAE